MTSPPLSEAEAVTQLRRFVAALEAGDRQGANVAAFSLIEGQARLGDRWQMIAKVMQKNGELTAANAAMKLFAEHHSGNPRAVYLQAATLAQTGRVEQAWALMQSVPRAVPDLASNGFLRGTIALNLGQTDLAEEILLEALDAAPAQGQVMLALATARKRKVDDRASQRILGARPVMASAPALERANFHFAAGTVLFDRSDVKGAFADFASGASLMRGLRRYDASADARDADACRAGFDRDFVSRVNREITVETGDPIFVTGLPRSGTTLVEQILASHSAVGGGEEIGRMAILERDLAGKSAAHLDSYLDRGGKADALASLYLHLARERFGTGSRFVDKSLDNSRYIGLIASLLPKAPIIWLRRDSLDCAWSSFRTYFSSGLDWSWNLEDIATHFALEDELFRHWSSLFPDRILVVDYQKLVQSPEVEIPRILDHCGLPLEPQVFRPHETRRVVSTASVMQVREPINTGAIGAAFPYRDHLAPFVERYGALTGAAPATP